MTANPFNPEQIVAERPFTNNEMSRNDFLSHRQLMWCVSALLLYFGARLLYFAVNISHYVPPDEVTHFGISQLFSKVLLLPENSAESYQYGLVTNIPWLYYWIMGKLLSLNFFSFSDLIFLRILNIPFAFGTVYFAWRTLCLLTADRLSQLLLFVVMTNTCMFSFLSASISYDNLTNLLGAMSVYYLLAFFQNGAAHLLVKSVVCQLAGCLTKPSFLPLILILNFLLLVHEFRNLHALGQAVTAYFRHGNWRSSTLLLAGFFCLVLNLQLYAGNLLRYKNIAPEMSVVLSPELALKNRIAARNLIFDLFREQRISFDQALEMTSVIEHPGDRADAILLVENYAKHVSTASRLLSPLSYIVPWTMQILAGIFGIKAHLSIGSYWLTNISIVILMALTVLAILIRWRPRRDQLPPTYLGIIAGFYVIFLMYAVNYRTYLWSASFPLALQGRYIFPVIGPIYVLSCYYLLRLFPERSARLFLTAAVTLLFIASDFPLVVYHLTPDWFQVWNRP